MWQQQRQQPYSGWIHVVYMGEVDIERQKLNVFMRLLGAEVRPALSGSRTLKDAINEAMRDWVATVEDSHYCLGSVMALTLIHGWSENSTESLGLSLFSMSRHPRKQS